MTKSLKSNKTLKNSCNEKMPITSSLNNPYKATLEILKILDKYKLSWKDAKIIFNIILFDVVEDYFEKEEQKNDK